MIALRGTRPGRATLANERQAVSKRLSVLVADYDGADKSSDEQLLDIREAISEALRRIAELDAALADADALPLLEQSTPKQRRGEARGRLLLTLEILRDMPTSCAAATRLLRKQIRAELQTIEASRREEFSTGGTR